MRIMTENMNAGHLVAMKTSHPLHFGEGRRIAKNDDVSSTFADMLNSALGKVNDLQSDSEELTQRMIAEPESVDIHTVMIAAQKAEIAMSFTKAVRDEAIKTYRELMNLR